MTTQMFQAKESSIYGMACFFSGGRGPKRFYVYKYPSNFVGHKQKKIKELGVILLMEEVLHHLGWC